MRRVIYNQKGGVGKTSISCNLAAISAARGLRTLLIDLDIQGNSSGYLLGDDYQTLDDNAASFFKQFIGILKRKRATMNYIYDTPFENLCILPSHPDLSSIERELESRQKVYKLRNALAELDDEFDRIYIDSPPAYNFYTNSALIAADSLLIPFDCDCFSLSALNNIVSAVNEIKEDHNAGLNIEGIIVNQYHGRANFHRDLIKKLKDDGMPVLEPFLSTSVKMKESRDLGRPLIYYAPRHKLTLQMTELFSNLESDLKKSRKPHSETKAVTGVKEEVEADAEYRKIA